ncbi:MAG: hypothetical protein A4E63_01604 [Syntrophorhabdus sp. PtaU1.Bin050]|nr:MAG: hypothetical protein A4E63_01604 [Syntrophorhabdus sp. PtaU1.Bin050]
MDFVTKTNVNGTEQSQGNVFRSTVLEQIVALNLEQQRDYVALCTHNDRLFF